MPVIEFIGYSREEILSRVERYQALVADLPFAEDVIFIIDEGSRARCLDGTSKPFLRVRSRFRERNEATRRLLGGYEDIECVVADFQPRRGSGRDSRTGDDR